MKTTYTIEIAAPPERVFHWLEDNERVMRWVPNLVESEDLELTPEKVGSTFRHVYVENGKRIEMHGMVAAYAPNRRLTCDIIGDAFELTIDYTLDYANGNTRLTQDTEIRVKRWFVKLVFRLFASAIRKSMLKQLEQSFVKLKELCEADVPTDA